MLLAWKVVAYFRSLISCAEQIVEKLSRNNKNIEFLLISFDYIYDTPEILSSTYQSLESNHPNIKLIKKDLNLINNNYEISLLIDNQKNHADSHSVFVVDKFVKSVRSKSEKCNSQFAGIVKFSKNGSIALNKILDNFHKQNNLDGEIIRIFEKLIDDSFPLHACFTNNQKWFNVNDLSQLESSRVFFGP